MSNERHDPMPWINSSLRQSADSGSLQPCDPRYTPASTEGVYPTRITRHAFVVDGHLTCDHRPSDLAVTAVEPHRTCRWCGLILKGERGV